MRYVVKLTAEFEVGAENVAQAMAAARRSIHAIGERAGGVRRGRHERDWTGYHISRVSEALDKPRRLT